MVFRVILNVAVIGMGVAASTLGGCSMPSFDRPDWSLNGPKPVPVSSPVTQPKKYGDWNGPNSPKPLTYSAVR